MTFGHLDVIERTARLFDSVLVAAVGNPRKATPLFSLEDVFAVLDGRVEMRYRENGVELSTVLEAGDVFHATVGTEHVAHPIGEARILVIEQEGSA